MLALAVSAFAFNTTENLPIGVLPLMAADLGVPLSAVGLLVTGYGLTVAVVSLPLAHATRDVQRRLLLTVLLAVFVVATLLTALTSNYWLLLGARVATAMAQALFWAVMTPAAVAMFPPGVRGRVVAVLSVGGGLAMVAGVPAGTWLGQQGGWRSPFLVLSVLGVLTLVAVAGLLPRGAGGRAAVADGTTPDRRRYVVVLLTTVVSVMGMFTAYTYVVAFLTEIGGLSAEEISLALLAFGVAGIAGVVVVGAVLDRAPRLAMAVPVGLQAAALLGLNLLGATPAAIPVMALLGFAAAPVFTATQTRVMQVAPGRAEMALAANSALFNVGLAGGALLGGLVLSWLGLSATFLVGAALSAVAFAVACAESRVAVARDGTSVVP